jgi:hypothetical protein
MRGVLGNLVNLLIFLACTWGAREILLAHEFPREPWTAALGVAAWLLAAYVTGTVVHELGHAAGVRLIGSRLDAIQLGGHLLKFTVRGVRVSVGPGLGGHVLYDSNLVSPQRRAVVLLAGPLANLLVAPASFLLPVPRWEAAAIALYVLPSALQDLVPAYDDEDDNSTDGAKLARIPASMRAEAEVRALLATPDWLHQPGAADTLINGFRRDVRTAADCLRELSHQPDRLLPLYLQEWTLPDKPEADVLHIVDVLTWKVLITGSLPPATADLAASRAEWVLDHLPEGSKDKRIAADRVRPTLALARLRQGRTGEVNRLCAGSLAADLKPDERASVLAVVAMAKHARLLSATGRAALDEALALDPDAPLVAEAVAALSRDPVVTA